MNCYLNELVTFNNLVLLKLISLHNNLYWRQEIRCSPLLSKISLTCFKYSIQVTQVQDIKTDMGF